MIKSEFIVSTANSSTVVGLIDIEVSVCLPSNTLADSYRIMEAVVKAIDEECKAILEERK